MTPAGFGSCHCRPRQFTGYSGGFVESVELLFTPDRVTLTNESGLIRRIYTDGRSLPGEVDPSNSGMSVGHWEGETLVVETIGIDPQALYPEPIAGAVPIGRNVKITERISLRDADTLQFEITTTAPEIFIAPDRRTRLYKRVPKLYGCGDQFLHGLRQGHRSQNRQATVRHDPACRSSAPAASLRLRALAPRRTSCSAARRSTVDACLSSRTSSAHASRAATLFPDLGGLSSVTSNSQNSTTGRSTRASAMGASFVIGPAAFHASPA